MIYLTYLSEDRKLNITDDSLKLLIVRKPPEVMPKGFIHGPQLSPSLELFFKTKKWKKGVFTEEEMDFINTIPDIIELDYWWELYRSEFMKELNDRDDMKSALLRLLNLDKEGSNIYLYCFCSNTHRCHRSLVGEKLKDLGANVTFEVPKKNNNSSQMNLFDI